MFNKSTSVSPVNPDHYSPDQAIVDKNADPAVGGVDWDVESSVSDPVVPVKGPVAEKYDPSKRYFERNAEMLKDRPGASSNKVPGF